MTLKESARMWLNNYKAGRNGPEYTPRIEDWAELISEYLYQDDAESKKRKALEERVELLHEDLMTEQGKTAELEKRNKELEFQLAGAENRVLRLEGENSAYRFAIRCNGMSGAEVRP